MNYAYLADKALRGEALSRDEARAVLHTPNEELLLLLDAAYRVRRHHCGRTVHLHMLVNAKSGLCPEDCGYCSQSSVSTAEIDKYPWLNEEQLMDGARRAKQVNAKRYCIVASGRSPTQGELDNLARIIRRIKQDVGIGVCTSLGLLTEDKALMLKEAGVDQVNHNLNTSERYYPEICTTHTYQDRVATLRTARAAGLQLCCGAIFGQGETEEDILDVIYALRDLEVESVPCNFLHPIPGTPLENNNYLTPFQCLRILCLVRLLNPASEVRVAGGREFHLRSVQPLMLYPANSLFVSGYLTTPGQRPKEAMKMIEDMGFELVTEAEYANA